MDKRKPAFNLNAFKAAFASVENLRATGTAVRSAAALGFGAADAGVLYVKFTANAVTAFLLLSFKEKDHD